MRQVETEAQGRVVGLLGTHLAAFEDGPVAQPREDADRFIERGEALVQGAGRQAIVTGQCVV